ANRDLADDVDHCLLIYADNLSNVNLSAFLKFHNESGAPFTMLLFHTPYPKSCGIATLDATGTIIEFVEKPGHPVSDLADGGVYAMTADAYREIADMGGFDIGYDVLPKFTGRMKGFVHDGYHRDIGTLESLAQAEADVRAGLFEITGGGKG
ncbi:MAG: sugar phosphate nucleotidyltransferase, partial [Proteobacteria bacterium]|nr:sugar phosphate nucleotidyltransferase [Pseudomonadota bacterium]